MQTKPIMTLSFIRIEKKERIAFITLCRAEKKNALNDLLVTELTDTFSSLEKDEDIKVIVLKAEGDVYQRRC